MGTCIPKPTPPTPTPTPPPPKQTPPPPTPTPTPTPPPTPPPPKRETTEDFSSDHVDVKIDKASDEIKIEDNLKGYPKPEPPNQVDGNQQKRKNIWFEDDEFNYGSDDADIFNIETGQDGDDDLDYNDDTSIAPSQITRRGARPAIGYEFIDEHAKLADAEHRSSFEKLNEYLSIKVKEDGQRKALLARAIIVWLSVQSIDNEDYGTPSRDSPNGLLQSLKNKTMTYAACYAILCRKAGLQCVRVNGYVKAAGYEPGDTDIPETAWNAVHVETGWEIVHPYWICRALYGHNLGGWVKVEKDGQSMRTKERASDGIVRNTFQDRYFMPDPQEFVYECCAKDPGWQLVEKPVKSKEEFAKLPYLLPPFFGVGLTLLSEQSCELKSEAGFSKIEMKGKAANAHMLVLRYELFMKDDDSNSLNDEDQYRMVFNQRCEDILNFELRFLKTGIYKLVVYGGPHKSPALRLFETKIVCDKELKGRNLLPLSCPRVGWGPGPISREAGLHMPSKINGLIGVSKTEKKADIKFHLEDTKTKYSAQVHGEVDGKVKVLNDNINVNKSEKDKLITIIVSIPGEGEFGVTINVETGKNTTNVCNYLLSTYAFKFQKANVKIAKQKLHDKVAENVPEERWKTKIEGIEECIDKCKKQKIPDSDEDIRAAYNELNHLKCRYLLRQCMLRRHLGWTRKTLDNIYKYKNKSLLQKEIEAVQRLEQELIQLHGCSTVPSLKVASQRIANLLHSSGDVKGILQAVFELTGDSKSANYDWNNMLYYLRKNRMFLVEKMSRLKSTDVPSEKIKKVKSILSNVKEDQIRGVNIDVYKFYQWVTSIVTQ